MAKAKPASASQVLNQLLNQLNQEGGFLISVLTDNQGFSLAAAVSNGMDSDVQSAVVAQVQKIAAQVGRQLGMAQASEIVLNDSNGQRLVCRPFHINGHDLILAVTVPDKVQSYRRVTNKAIEAIRQVWQSYWE